MYSLGGRDKDFMGIRARIWKRIFSPIFLSASVLGLSLILGKFSLWFLLAPVLYFAHGYIFGYGGDTFWTKVLRRSLWSIFITACALPIAIVTHGWAMFALQGVIGLILTLTAGLVNPITAPEEEFLIYFSSTMFVPFMV